MTSSLVGSEMCIRDSKNIMFNGFKEGSSCVCKKTTPQVLWGILPTIPAVSYTHLTLPTICSV
eukprot:5825800-Prorocentrum_lima.AAC.1